MWLEAENGLVIYVAHGDDDQRQGNNIRLLRVRSTCYTIELIWREKTTVGDAIQSQITRMFYQAVSSPLVVLT